MSYIYPGILSTIIPRTFTRSCRCIASQKRLLLHYKKRLFDLKKNKIAYLRYWCIPYEDITFIVNKITKTAFIYSNQIEKMKVCIIYINSMKAVMKQYKDFNGWLHSLLNPAVSLQL